MKGIAMAIFFRKISVIETFQLNDPAKNQQLLNYTVKREFPLEEKQRSLSFWIGILVRFFSLLFTLLWIIFGGNFFFYAMYSCVLLFVARYVWNERSFRIFIANSSLPEVFRKTEGLLELYGNKVVYTWYKIYRRGVQLSLLGSLFYGRAYVLFVFVLLVDLYGELKWHRNMEIGKNVLNEIKNS